MRTSVLLRWGLVVPVVVVELLVGYVHVLGPRAVAMEPGLTPLLTPLYLATWVGAALVGVAVALGWTWLGLHTGARASARGVRLLGWWWVSAAVVVRRRPTTRWVDLPGTGHDAHLDAFDAWAATLSALLGDASKPADRSAAARRRRRLR